MQSKIDSYDDTIVEWISYDQFNEIKILGISQNPDTKDYIIVLQDGYCEICGKIYTDIKNKEILLLFIIVN